MTAAERIAALVDSLATAYPARAFTISNRVGSAVTAVVMPAQGTYENPVCDPGPVIAEADVTLIGSQLDEHGGNHLMQQIDPAAALIRAAGWVVQTWRGGTDNGLPTVTITATTTAEG